MPNFFRVEVQLPKVDGERWGYLSSLIHPAVYLLNPRMGKYLLASSEFPQSPILVFVHQLQDKVLGVFADTAVWWEGHLLVYDAISGLEGSQPGTIKGRVADQHFEE